MTAPSLSDERLAELRVAYLAGSKKESMTEPTKSRCRDAVAAIDELIRLRGDQGICTKGRLDGFTEAAKPLIRWLSENYHPHVTAIVTPTSANLCEGLLGTGELPEFVRD